MTTNPVARPSLRLPTMLDEKAIEFAASNLGPAMHLVFALATRRAHRPASGAEGPSSGRASDEPADASLWELAERFHPEEVWLAQSYLRGERTLGDLARYAPRGPVAAALRAAARDFFDRERRALPPGPSAPSAPAERASARPAASSHDGQTRSAD